MSIDIDGTGEGGTVTIRPSALQFVCDQAVLLAVLAFTVILPGLEAVRSAGLVKGALAVAALIAVLLASRYCVLRCIRYEITPEQLVNRHGVLGTTREYMELYRVIDFRESRSLMQRIFGLKTVTVVSQDRSTPQLDLKGIPAGYDIVSVLRTRVEENKKKRGVHEITNIN